ncbi:MAG: glycosyltransferase family 2 protein [Rhodospirillales bacterium]|nr:glycosyltransferase family 2 protein [Rhodospirillales bacterium]
MEHRIALVIPAYNEAATIRDIAEGALETTPHVIVVNDGSTDGTGAALDGLAVRRIDLDVNQGKAAALLKGFGEALAIEGVEGVVTLDGDGQHRTDDIARVAGKGLEDQNAIIVGSRLWDTERFPKSRLRANKVANFWISWAAGQRIADSQSGFRYYPASVLRRLDLGKCARQGFVLESELLILASWAGAPIRDVRIPALYGAETFRPSHFRPVADITHIVLMVAVKLLSRGMNIPGLIRYLRSGEPGE